MVLPELFHPTTPNTGVLTRRRLIPEGRTLTEYALARYGRAMYAFVVLVSVFYMFIFLSAEMTGIAGALGLVAGVPGWQTAVLIGSFVVLYTAYGGLRATVFTDTVQALLILPLLAVGFAAVPALPEDSLSTDQWLGLGLGVALIVCAALAMILRADGTLPVNATLPTSGCIVSVSPISSGIPVTTLISPGGSNGAIISMVRMSESGQVSGGFKTTALPASNAGMICALCARRRIRRRCVAAMR